VSDDQLFNGIYVFGLGVILVLAAVLLLFLKEWIGAGLAGALGLGGLFAGARDTRASNEWRWLHGKKD
jgi:hypothetical protein